MKKVTFLIPPTIKDKKVPDRVAGCAYVVYDVPNIFILIPAAVLKEKGFNVNYADLTIKRETKKDFIDFLRQDNSDIYIFYTVNLAIENDIESLALIRDVKGGIPVIFFGPSPTFWPEKFLKDENVYVVRGEPEITLLEVIKAIGRFDRDISSIQGLSYYKDENIFNNQTRPLIENLDTLPFPARNLIDKERYFNPKLRLRPFTAVFTSRGCSYRCIFCVPCSMNFAIELEYKKYHNKKPPVRLRSAANIIEEFKLLKAQGYKAVSIWDDLFVWGANRTIEICQGIKDLNLVWGCQSRADHLNEEILKEMAKAGCKYVDIGVESFCQEILDYVKKDMKVQTLIHTIKLIKKYGISVKINVMFGASSLESRATVRETQKIIDRLGVNQVMYNICSPFPGTEIYDMAKKERWFVKGEYEPSDVGKKAIITLPSLSDRDLEILTRKANLRFFLDPNFILKNIFKTGFFKLSELKDSIKALMRKLI